MSQPQVVRLEAIEGGDVGASCPRIELRPGHLPDARAALIAALQANPGGFHLHGARVVVVGTVQREALGGGKTESLELREVSPEEFLVACDSVAEFIRFKSVKGVITSARVDCTPRLAASIFKSPVHDLLPRIERLAEVPLLLEDGSLITSGLHQ